MNKKLLMGLAPLVVVAALAMPSAALAVPHFFSNGVIVGPTEFGAEGECLNEGTEECPDSISWGTLELKGETGAAAGGLISCHNVAAGNGGNPIGGAAGKGETETFAVFDCTSNLCAPTSETSVIAENIGDKVGEGWKNTLTEGGIPKANGFRQETTGVKVAITCAGVAAAHFKGSNKPSANAGLDKGTSAGHPGFLEFDAGSGELSLEEAPGTSKTKGTLNVLGYESQELAQVK